MLGMLLAAAPAAHAAEAPSTPVPSTPAPATPAQPAPPTADIDDDADLPPPVNTRECSSVPHPSSFIYDYSHGTVRDINRQGVPSPLDGSDVGQRLLLKDGCVGLLFEDLSSNIPYNGQARISSVAVVAGGESEAWEGYIGIGGSLYRAMGQDYSMVNLFFHIRRHIVWNLSGELYFETPPGAFFVSNDFSATHPNDPLMNGVVELALRMDWQHFALKYGLRTYQISYTLPGAAQPNSLQRRSVFLGATLKF